MKIKGWQKTSLIDYKPYIASVIFTGGCSFRCPYCYNPELVINPEKMQDISEKEIFDYIESKKTFIDAVCITGGEPCIYEDLIDFCRKLKEKGFLVKLNTNGSRPEILKKLIDNRLIDKVSMDIKSSFDNYDKIAGVKIDKEIIKKSIKMIMESNIDYEFNTTPVPGLVGKKEIFKIAKMIKGAKKYNLNDFQSDKELVGEELKDSKTFSKEELEELRKTAEEYVEKAELM